MKVRPEVYDAYWTFAAHRQEAFFNRLHNAPQPWIADPILQHYKFCNVYRASDRVSQYLIKNVIYSGSQQAEEVVFRILLFKIFNKIETWQLLESRLGEITLKNFDFDHYATLLQESLDAGKPIYTSAYISCASQAFGYPKKHQNHLALLEHMLRDGIAVKVAAAPSLQAVYELLLSYPLLGQFMAYQLAIDLNYSEVINFDENDFTKAGPGAKRGIAKCFTDLEGATEEDVIRFMMENQEKEFARLGLTFQSLWGRPLHLIDCQGLFCETDKYSRAAFPELKSNRRKIKATFAPNPERISYFYPPKWGLNNLLY